jgi:hypothetical protein
VSGEHSIWLLPARETSEYRTLDTVITEYAESCSDAPDVRPHVTVLGGVNEGREFVERRTRKPIRGVEPFELEFARVSCSTTNHQCVFRLVDPSVEVLELHQRALERFGVTGGMYVPHLSLVYSGMGLQDRVELTRKTDMESLPGSVRTDTVEAVSTGGDVSEWKTVATFGLE